MYQVLVCDDDKAIVDAARIYLESEGYAVKTAYNGKEAVAVAQKETLHCIILDIMMPVMDGLAACRAIREISAVPILMVTAREDEETEISGIHCGADQFISKPIRMRAFIERVRSLLRRSGSNQDALHFGRLELDPASGSARVDEQDIALTPKEFDLLLFLARTPNVVRSREQILQAVWNTDYFGDGRTVDTHVKNLRMKLGPCGDMVRTVRSRGYLLDWKQA